MTYCGLLLIDKPAGITSHTVVAILRKILKIDKIGHLGTLDPFATGLLPILVGGATRLSDEMISGKKQYLFTISLGIETDTLDASGRMIEQAEVPQDFAQKIMEVLPRFIGRIEQVPPVYSALKMDGKPLYEYMRATGKLPHSIETKKRTVLIEKFELISNDVDANTVTLRVLCEKGTYVRSLARDLAIAIHTRGHCIALRREIVEPWSVENALSISRDSNVNVELLKEKIIPVERILPHVHKIILDSVYLKALSSGNVILLPFEEMEKRYPFVADAFSIENKLFVSVKDEEQKEAVMFLSEFEIDLNKKIIKIKPKKKMI